MAYMQYHRVAPIVLRNTCQPVFVVCPLLTRHEIDFVRGSCAVLPSQPMLRYARDTNQNFIEAGNETLEARMIP